METGEFQTDLLSDALAISVGPSSTSRLSRYLSSFTSKPATQAADGQPVSSGDAISSGHSSAPLAVDSSSAEESSNPEADSFRYIETILESLGVIGKLSHALDVVAQRVAGEIHSLIETTLDEVEERYVVELFLADLHRSERNQTEETIHTLPAPDKIDPKALFNPTDAGQTSLTAASSPRQAIILQDLLWSLYSKLAAVLEGHRVLYEVSRWISAVNCHLRLHPSQVLMSASGLQRLGSQEWRPRRSCT